MDKVIFLEQQTNFVLQNLCRTCVNSQVLILTMTGCTRPSVVFIGTILDPVRTATRCCSKTTLHMVYVYSPPGQSLNDT